MESVEPIQHASDLIEFYAGGTLPQRQLELIKDRIDRRVQRQKKEELRPYIGYRETLRELQTIHSRRSFQPGVLLNLNPPLLRELLQLQPKDFLILTSPTRYQIPEEELSIILDMSVDHIRFRREQLSRWIAGSKRDDLQRICSAPVAAIQAEIEQARTQRRKLTDRLRMLPLPARFLIETGVVLSVLILLMWLIPEIRNRYESSIQKRINDYMIESTISDAPAPEGTSKTPRVVEASTDGATKEAVDEPESKPVEPQNKKPLKVAAGETWRFSFTGAATNDILSGVNETLKKLGLQDTKSVTVPGGIQFDLFIPTKDLTDLKLNLEEMTSQLQRRTTPTTPDTPSVVNMSWYKKRGMTGRKVPPGNVEVVIWISTL